MLFCAPRVREKKRDGQQRHLLWDYIEFRLSLFLLTNINGGKECFFLLNFCVSNEEEEEEERTTTSRRKEIESRLTYIYNENDKHIEIALWISLLISQLFNYTRHTPKLIDDLPERAI